RVAKECLRLACVQVPCVLRQHRQTVVCPRATDRIAEVEVVARKRPEANLGALRHAGLDHEPTPVHLVLIGIEREAEDEAALAIARAGWCRMTQALCCPIGDASVGCDRDAAAVILWSDQTWQRSGRDSIHLQPAELFARPLRQDDDICGSSQRRLLNDEVGAESRLQRSAEMQGM